MRLYRWATPEAVEALAGELRTLAIPSLVMSGARDPWFPTEVARAWAEAIPAAGLEVIDQAGHWPWLERPETIGRIADFMAAR
jgi:pimeloyl-ACP methyl ester carboxylesterase